MKTKQLVAVVILCVLCLAACIDQMPITQSQASLAVTQTPTFELTENKMTPYPIQTLSVQNEVLPTPTLRSVKTNIDCESASTHIGHILFLKMGRADISTGRNNLYIMDGNGCFPTLVMESVGGSPAWSSDGEKIAIVCDEDKYICILDAKIILDSCFGPERSDLYSCDPIILEKYPLPQWSGRVDYISWSSDNSRISIDGYDVVENKYFLGILDITPESKWTLSMQRTYAFESDWSPKDNKLVYTGGILDLDTGREYDFRGLNPQWFPSGEKISFYQQVWNEENRYEIEPAGIAMLDTKDETWDWVYEPAPWNSYDHEMGRIILPISNNYRQMSWEPSGRYLAFVTHYKHNYNNQIFRLDTLTGEIMVLTANFDLPKGGTSSIAPAWGP